MANVYHEPQYMVHIRDNEEKYHPKIIFADLVSFDALTKFFCNN